MPQIRLPCICLASACALTLLSSAQALEPVRAASVPTLAVLGDGRTGVVNYVAVQIDLQPRQNGPTVQFSEISLGGGSLVGADWKEGVKQAVTAVVRALGIDGREWVVTVKHRSYSAVTEGMSASSAVAVGVMAAWRGDAVRPDVAITGQIEPDGTILPVGRVPQKVEAAARERFRTVLIPRGQLKTDAWDLTAPAGAKAVDVVEVGTLEEAYRAMTGDAP